MPIAISLQLQRGWKTKNPDKRGDVLVAIFTNVQTNEVLFTYAPKWEDIPTWLKMLERLTEIEINKWKKRGIQHGKEKEGNSV